MLNVAKELKNGGAKQIILVSTFSLFTAGIEQFQKSYEAGIFNRLYTTNLTYVPMKIQKLDWFHNVDCSKQLAKIILEHSHDGKISKDRIENEVNIMKGTLKK